MHRLNAALLAFAIGLPGSHQMALAYNPNIPIAGPDANSPTPKARQLARNDPTDWVLTFPKNKQGAGLKKNNAPSKAAALAPGGGRNSQPGKTSVPANAKRN